MRRVASAAALAALFAAVLPWPPAHACSVPVPLLTLSRSAVPAGGTVGVSAVEYSGYRGGCPVPVPMPPPTPSESASPDPGESPLPVPSESASPDPSESPGESPSPVPSESPSDPGESPSPSPEAASPQPSQSVLGMAMRAALTLAPDYATVTISEEWDYEGPPPPERVIGTIPVGPRVTQRNGLVRHTLRGEVTIPADVPPGGYVLNANQQSVVYFGMASLRVLPALPATGRETGDLVRLAGLLVVAGVGALVAGYRRPRRARLHY